MSDLIALTTIILWPVVPLFWIPLHAFTKPFRKLGIVTYGMPLVMWLPLAYVIYLNRAFLLSFKIVLPGLLNILGILLLAFGMLLHIWTGQLMGLWGLVGLPEVSERKKGNLVTAGPFSVVRHPTYLAHTMIFLGVFLATGTLTVGLITALDFLLVAAVIIPLEEKELFQRFGEEYNVYKKSVPRLFPSTKKLFEKSRGMTDM